MERRSIRRTGAYLLILLLLILPSCGNNNDDSQFTADGRPLIQLSIGVDSSRALTDYLAKNGSDFYEVTFRNGDTGEVFRSSWYYTQTGSVRVTPGNYGLDLGDKKNGGAVLFAGISNGKILQAVGMLTAPGNGIINKDTGSVTFSLQALTNNIIDDPYESSFQITENNYETKEISPPFPVATIYGVSYPLYEVPIVSAGETVSAEYYIGLGSSIYGINNTSTTPFSGIQNADTNLIQIRDNIIISSIGITDPVDELLNYTSLSLDGKVTITPSIPSDGLGFPIDGKFEIKIDTFITPPLTPPYLSALSFKIPVNAIETKGAGDPNVYTVPINWHIQGGIQDRLFDAGVSANSQGGAILLKIQ